MIALRTLMMLLGTLAVLMLGTVSAKAETAPPCHEAMSGHPAPDAPPATDGPIQVMACCVACVTSPILTPPARITVALSPHQPSALLTHLPPGRSEIPAHGPPRLPDA